MVSSALWASMAFALQFGGRHFNIFCDILPQTKRCKGGDADVGEGQRRRIGKQ